MSENPKYELLHAQAPRDLNNLVNDRLEKGYILRRNTHYNSGYFYQAVVLPCIYDESIQTHKH